jgi:hypothetical protein
VSSATKAARPEVLKDWVFLINKKDVLHSTPELYSEIINNVHLPLVVNEGKTASPGLR